MTEIEWRESTDPEELAAAVAAGMRVEYGDEYGWAIDDNVTADDFASGMQSFRFRYPVLPPLVPEGMTAERLREAADDIDRRDTAAIWRFVSTLRRWADEIEGGGADDREASDRSVAPVTEPPPPSPEDPFPVGCRVKHADDDSIGRVVAHSDGSIQVAWDADGSWHMPQYLTRIDSEPSPDAPESWPLAEAWGDCARHVEAGGVVEVEGPNGWINARATPSQYRSWSGNPGTLGWRRHRLVPIPAPTPESSPDGEGEEVEVDPLPSDPADRLRWIAGSGYIEAPAICNMVRRWADEAAAERDALAAKLAALPEMPDGYEVLVVEPWVSDEVAEWAGCNQLEAALAEAGSDAVARRPKPEPRTERDLLPIEIEPDEDDGGYVASCVIPGVFGQGETIPGAVADLVAAFHAMEGAK